MLAAGGRNARTQSDYAAALTAGFDTPDAGPTPALVLAEAGTGTGKTLGYLAPATLWAETNGAPVWISTYTRTLQHQIASELSASIRTRTLGPQGGDPQGARKLSLPAQSGGSAGQLGGAPRRGTALGLMARWAGRRMTAT